MNATLLSFEPALSSTCIIFLTHDGISKNFNHLMRYQVGYRFKQADVPEWPILRDRLVCQVREDKEERRLYVFVR